MKQSSVMIEAALSIAAVYAIHAQEFLGKPAVKYRATSYSLVFLKAPSDFVRHDAYTIMGSLFKKKNAELQM